MTGKWLFRLPLGSIHLFQRFRGMGSCVYVGRGCSVKFVPPSELNRCLHLLILLLHQPNSSLRTPFVAFIGGIHPNPNYYQLRKNEHDQMEHFFFLYCPVIFLLFASPLRFLRPLLPILILPLTPPQPPPALPFIQSPLHLVELRNRLQTFGIQVQRGRFFSARAVGEGGFNIKEE